MIYVNGRICIYCYYSGKHCIQKFNTDDLVSFVGLKLAIKVLRKNGISNDLTSFVLKVIISNS